MNFRAPLDEADIERNLAPVEPNVTKLPPGGPPPAPRGKSLDELNRDALEALHTYICAATNYDLPRSITIFKGVVSALDTHLRQAAK